MGHSCHVNFTEVTGAYRKVLWIALFVNAGMFLVENSAGILSGSVALLADSIDFLSDAATYAISLLVLNKSLHTRAKASMFKAATMFLFGIWVLIAASYQAYEGTLPHAATMGWVGLVAMVANLAVAILLYRYRSGDSNMRSVWLCTRNDAIGNIFVMIAAAGVFASSTFWPDFIVAVIMGILGISAAISIAKQSFKELKHKH